MEGNLIVSRVNIKLFSLKKSGSGNSNENVNLVDFSNMQITEFV
jgi:hypothetical protein